MFGDCEHPARVLLPQKLFSCLRLKFVLDLGSGGSGGIGAGGGGGGGGSEGSEEGAGWPVRLITVLFALAVFGEHLVVK